MQTEKPERAPTTPGVQYQAGIVAYPEIHEKLALLHLDVIGGRELRPDGSSVQRAVLKPEQIESIVPPEPSSSWRGLSIRRFRSSGS